MEQAAMEYIDRIDEMGGIVKAVEEGYPQREIARSAYDYQKKVERLDRVIVGINKYQHEGGDEIPTLKIELEVEQAQKARIAEVRARRDQAKVKSCLDDIREAARDEGACIFYPILAAVREYATLGEICDIFREEFGEHSDPAFL
jgi:methylmalonyl-CoA mutase N-terminal domain/subunit